MTRMCALTNHNWYKTRSALSNPDLEQEVLYIESTLAVDQDFLNDPNRKRYD